MHRIIQNIIQVLKVIHGLVDIELRKHFFLLEQSKVVLPRLGSMKYFLMNLIIRKRYALPRDVLMA